MKLQWLQDCRGRDLQLRVRSLENCLQTAFVKQLVYFIGRENLESAAQRFVAASCVRLRYLCGSVLDGATVIDRIRPLGGLCP